MGPWALGTKLAGKHVAFLAAGSCLGALAFLWIQAELMNRMSISNPQPADFLTVFTAAAVLVVVGLAGCAIPMARVAACEPGRILRSE